MGVRYVERPLGFAFWNESFWILESWKSELTKLLVGMNLNALVLARASFSWYGQHVCCSIELWPFFYARTVG